MPGYMVHLIQQDENARMTDILHPVAYHSVQVSESQSSAQGMGAASQVTVR